MSDAPRPARAGRFGRWSDWVVAAVVLIAIIMLRRWVHHAQLESTPVIVPADVAARDVVAPPAATIARRMLKDVEDIVTPPKWPRLAVLTFDDGPFPVTTPLLVAELHALNVPAVFFIIGRDAQEQPALTLRAHAAGIELGNHTQTHPEMKTLSQPQQAMEITEGASTIRRLTGIRPTYFRPPHGAYDAATIDAARAAGDTVALWDVDPGDWRVLTADRIVDNVLAHGRSPAVLLLHNGKFATLEALPRIVKAYRAAGFEFVTLSQLQARLSLPEINDPVRVALQ